MSALNNLYQNLNPKKRLPSAQERAGMRMNPGMSPEDVLEFKNFRDNSPEEYNNLVNGELNNYVHNATIPEGTQLNLFATSGPEAFGDFLDSDAVTGMNDQDLNNLDVQYTVSNPEAVSEALQGMPEIFEAMNESNGPQGMEAFANLSPALATAGKLARLYSLLEPLLK